MITEETIWQIIVDLHQKGAYLSGRYLRTPLTSSTREILAIIFPLAAECRQLTPTDGAYFKSRVPLKWHKNVVGDERFDAPARIDHAAVEGYCRSSDPRERAFYRHLYACSSYLPWHQKRYEGYYKANVWDLCVRNFAVHIPYEAPVPETSLSLAVGVVSTVRIDDPSTNTSIRISSVVGLSAVFLRRRPPTTASENPSKYQ
jgi:hypothetical protein